MCGDYLSAMQQHAGKGRAHTLKLGVLLDRGV